MELECICIVKILLKQDLYLSDWRIRTRDEREFLFRLAMGKNGILSGDETSAIRRFHGIRFTLSEF